MKSDKYNSGLKKVGNSYIIKQTNYQKSKQLNNNDILTTKIKDNVKESTTRYSKSLSVKIVKSPYSIAKGMYKLDKSVDSYLSKPTKVSYSRSKEYTIKNSAYNTSKNKLVDKKYTTKNNNKLKSKFVYRRPLRFESKIPVDWDKAKYQRKLEDVGRYLGKNKELKLRSIRDYNLNKWVSKKFRFIEKLGENIKNKSLYPYKSTKSNFKETFKKVREGENEAGREAIQKIEKQGKRAIDTGKYLVKSQIRKGKFAKYKRIKEKKLNEKIERVSSINRFKKSNVSKLNAGRFSGKERFLKKKRDLKKFKINNRYLLRQRFMDRLKLGFRNFFNGLKNPIQFISGLFRGLALLKTILLIAIPFIIIASVFSGIGMQAKTHAVNENTVLVEQNRIFSEMHSSRYSEKNFLNEVKSKYPGYDKYEVDLSDVGYDNYELLAYLNIAYGNVEDNKEEMMALIREDLQEIFNEIYKEKLEETRATKIEYVEEIREDGTVEKVPKEKTYVYLKVKVLKTNKLKDIYLTRLYSRKEDNWFFNKEIEDNDIKIWFDELVKNKLGVAGLFAVTVNGNVAISGIISREAFSSENSEFGEPKLNNIDPNGSGYAFGQCTWYAFQRRSEIGRPLAHSYFGDGGSWWITAQNLGMEVNHTPKAGAVASFPGGVAGAFHPWGHVAFVEKVNEDGSIEVSEMHGGNTVDGIIRYRHIPKEAIPYTYFIH